MAGKERIPTSPEAPGSGASSGESTATGCTPGTRARPLWVGDCLRRAAFQVPGRASPVTLQAPAGETFRACDEYTLPKIDYRGSIDWEGTR